MNTELVTARQSAPPATTTDIQAAVMEQVLLGGDLSKLTPPQRLFYYQQVCESVGLNPLTRPFLYLSFQGKLVLYATKEAAEQLRINRQISIIDMRRETIGDVVLVTVVAQDGTGRRDTASGSLSMVYPATITEWVNGQKRTSAHPKAGKPLEGDDLANALMKAETKAKRRVTLSMCGLSGRLRDDVSEDDVNGSAVIVNPDTGEIGQPQARIEAQNPELLQVRIMCRQLYGEKADAQRAWLAGKVSNGRTEHTSELTPAQVGMALAYLEAEAASLGWVRDPDGHWTAPGPVAPPPPPIEYQDAVDDLFGPDPDAVIAQAEPTPPPPVTGDIESYGDAPASRHRLAQLHTIGKTLHGAEWQKVCADAMRDLVGRPVQSSTELTVDQCEKLIRNLQKQMPPTNGAAA